MTIKVKFILFNLSNDKIIVQYLNKIRTAKQRSLNKRDIT